MSSSKAKETLVTLSAHEIADLVSKGKLAPTEVTEIFLDHIEELNRKYNAIIAFDRENALQQAREIEKKSLKDQRLMGVPVAVSDRCSVKGLPSTLGSKFLEGTSCEEDSLEIQRLKNSGAIIIGKTNCAEFFLAPIAENVRFGKTYNPFGKNLNVGGAEAGASVAVAAGMCPLAVVIDGFGSIRLSSSYCGVLGLKPSRGLIPLVRSNQVPFSHRTFSQLGPVSRNVKDAARLVSILGTYDCRDSFCILHENVNLEEGLKTKPKKLKIGCALDEGFVTVEKPVMKNLHQAVEVLKDLGHEVEEFNLGLDEEIYIHTGEICFADSYLPILHMIESGARSLDEMNVHTKTWLSKGKNVTGVGYSLALSYVDWLRQHIDSFFGKYDLIMTPTVSLTSASKASKNLHPQFGLWSLLLPFNLSGHPAISVPFVKDPAPYGIHFVAPYFDEMTLLSIAQQFQKIGP